MPIPMFGHVGDGNFHLVIPVRPDNRAEAEEAKAFNQRLVDRALAMEGTCTGEHGIGMGKIDYLKKEHGEGHALTPVFQPFKVDDGLPRDPATQAALGHRARALSGHQGVAPRPDRGAALRMTGAGVPGCSRS